MKIHWLFLQTQSFLSLHYYQKEDFDLAVLEPIQSVVLPIAKTVIFLCKPFVICNTIMGKGKLLKSKLYFVSFLSIFFRFLHL